MTLEDRAFWYNVGVVAGAGRLGMLERPRRVRKCRPWEFPQVVREARNRIWRFVFVRAATAGIFAEYLTGLMVAANKTVTGINGEFVETAESVVSEPFCYRSRVEARRQSTNGGWNCCSASDDALQQPGGDRPGRHAH